MSPAGTSSSSSASSTDSSRTDRPTACEVCADRLTSCVTERTSCHTFRLECERRVAELDDRPAWSAGAAAVLMGLGAGLAVWGALRIPDPARPQRPDWPLVGVGSALVIGGGVVLLRW